MKKRLTIFMVMCVFALSGFVSVITSNKNVFAEESTDAQSLTDKIEEAKLDIENKQAYLENLLQKAKVYISKEGKGISPAVQAKRYLSQFGKDNKSVHIEEFKTAVETELKHIEDLAAKKYKGVYIETPELTNIKKKLSTSILVLENEKNYIPHVKDLQNNALSKKDLNKAKTDAEMLKNIVNMYVKKMQNNYADSFILANEFKNAVNDLADKTVQEVYRRIEEEKARKELNNTPLVQPVEEFKGDIHLLKLLADTKEAANEKSPKPENKPQLAAPEIAKERKDSLKAPNTGEKNNNFELITISFAATLLTALSVVVLKKF